MGAASRKVHCLECYNKLFPDAGALQNQQRQLQSWLQQVVSSPNSEGAWKEPLRGFLEAARQFLASAPAQAVAIASAPPSAAVAPEQAAKPVVAPSAPPPEYDTVQSDEGAMMSIQIPAGVAA